MTNTLDKNSKVAKWFKVETFFLSMISSEFVII